MYLFNSSRNNSDRRDAINKERYKIYNLLNAQIDLVKYMWATSNVIKYFY